MAETINSIEIQRIPQLVGRRAEHAPEIPAIYGSQMGSLTYGEVQQEISYAFDKLASFGLGKRDVVAAVLPDGVEAALAFLCISSCSIYAPLNPDYQVGELEFYLSDLEAKAVCVLQGEKNPVRAVADKIGLAIIELALGESSSQGILNLSFPEQALLQSASEEREDEGALILYTSGTSSKPKKVQLTHKNIFVSARNIAEAVELSESDRCLSVMPLFHIHGLSALFATLYAGGSIHCPKEFSSDTFSKNFKSYQPTWYTAAPTIHYEILAQVRKEPELTERHALRFLRSASAPMPTLLIADLEAVFGVPFIEAYGMTEAGPQISSNRLPPALRKVGSAGKPAGPEVVILNGEGETLGVNEEGEVAARGDNMAAIESSSVNGDDPTIHNGWFRTGDVGYLDDEGYLFITGRLKEVINRGGEKISLREVDRCLERHPAVKEVASFGTPHPTLGEYLAAAVVLENGEEHAQADLQPTLQAFVADHLAPFKVPQQILFLDHLGRRQRKWSMLSERIW